MRSFTKSFLAVGVVALMLAVSSIAVDAQGMRQGVRGSMGRMGAHSSWMSGAPGMMGSRMMMLRGLNLSDQQKEQVKAIVDNHKAEMQSIFKESIEARKALSDDIYKGADPAVLQTDYGRLSSAGLNGMMLRARIWNEIKAQNILTSDQMTQLQTREQKMDQRYDRMLNRMSAAKEIGSR